MSIEINSILGGSAGLGYTCGTLTNNLIGWYFIRDGKETRIHTNDLALKLDELKFRPDKDQVVLRVLRHSDIGPNRSERIPGSGFEDLEGYLPTLAEMDAVMRSVGDLNQPMGYTVAKVYHYVRTRHLPNGVPMAQYVQSELAALEPWVKDAGHLSINKGGYQDPRWVRVLYQALRAKLLPSMVDSAKELLRSMKPLLRYTDYELPVIIVGTFGLRGGVGSGAEKGYFADLLDSFYVAREDLVNPLVTSDERLRLPAETKLSIDLSRLGIGFSSYTGLIRNSDGVIMDTELRATYETCTNNINFMLNEGRDVVVLNEQGSVLGPAWYHLTRKVTEASRYNINAQRAQDADGDGGGERPMPVTFYSTRTISDPVLTRITHVRVTRYDGTPRTGLVTVKPAEAGGLFGIGKRPRQVILNEAKKFVSREHLAKELTAVRQFKVKDLVREHGLTADEEATLNAELSAYGQRLHAILASLPQDPTRKHFIAPHESAMVPGILALPLSVTPEMWEKVPTTLANFQQDSFVFFSSAHRTRNRLTLTGNNGMPYVVHLLEERGPASKFTKGYEVEVQSSVWKR